MNLAQMDMGLRDRCAESGIGESKSDRLPGAAQIEREVRLALRQNRSGLAGANASDLVESGKYCMEFFCHGARGRQCK